MRYALTLDLKDDRKLIEEYKRLHAPGKAWPAVTKSILDAGVESMEIYLLGTRLFMIMDVNEKFSFSEKAKADRLDPKVQEWEQLMWKYQQPLPHAAPGEKWMLMENIFKLP